MYQSILVPVDGSTHAEHALKVAAQLAKGTSATLHLMTVAEFPPDNLGLFTGGTPEPFTEEDRDKLAAGMKEEARKAIDKARAAADFSGIEVQEVVRQGRPAELIIQEAKTLGADVIVMGSRGISDVRGMVFGSVSHKVSHAADCSVITVT
ncbi:universal stress protein [Halomonas daqiaonensis]|uniref:Nucleotide-binding universal stress protein, UspA family n=1 Tax=Halomonas daqiaonensis TaxID=650850 RepID=A0A1H7T107_9GAMM|nr:universal stress protein [Halomonas daqiaonensis]SEL78179.1 Nucleotide-binding universal stress protein, UspA family [Halomonas daqiaonensis]